MKEEKDWTKTFWWQIVLSAVSVTIGLLIVRAIFPSDCDILRDELKTEKLKIEALMETVDNINAELNEIRENLKTETGKTDAALELMRQYRKINRLEEQLKISPKTERNCTGY